MKRDPDVTIERVTRAEPDVHTYRGGSVIHAWDCKPCVAANAAKLARDNAANPHRAGTKAAARFAAEASMVRLAVDPRSETYWSM